MGFDLSARDLARLAGVHPDMVRVIRRAAMLSPERFVVIEGLRGKARQAELLAKGLSQTMNSRHIKAANGWAHATDIAYLDDVDGDGHVDDIATDWRRYYPLAEIVKRAAAIEDVPIEWGGDWKKFKDGPHWQLPWSSYPGTAAVGLMQSDVPFGEPDDWPYERDLQLPTKRALTGGGIGTTLIAAAAAAWEWLQSGNNLLIVCVAVVAAIALIVFRERIGDLVFGPKAPRIPTPDPRCIEPLPPLPRAQRRAPAKRKPKARAKRRAGR